MFAKLFEFVRFIIGNVTNPNLTPFVFYREMLNNKTIVYSAVYVRCKSVLSVFMFTLNFKIVRFTQ